MNRFTLEMKVGVFFVGIFILIAWISLKLGNYELGASKGFTISVLLDSAAGLNEETPVLMAGLRIGQVMDRKLENGKARVFMKINYGSQIPVGSTIDVMSRGFLGAKYLEIAPGQFTGNIMKNGDSFPVPKGAGGLDAVTAQAAAIGEDLKAVTATLKEVFGSEEGKARLNGIFANFGTISQSIADQMEENRAQIHQIIKSVEAVTKAMAYVASQNQENMSRTLAAFPEIAEHMADISRRLNLILAANEKDMDKAIGNLAESTEKLNSAMGSVSEIMRKVDAGEGAAGKLISDRETAEKLTDALDGLNDFVQRARRLKTELNYRGEYQMNSGDLKSYLNLKIQPKYDKYYMIGIVDDPSPDPSKSDSTSTVTLNPGTPNERTTVKEVHSERTNDQEIKVSAQIAKRWHDFVFRGGILESTGGVGAEYWAFNDHFNLNFEAYDFGADTNPKLKGYANFLFAQHFQVTTGFDDFINKYRDPTFFVGGGLYFSDDDLSLLFTRIPMPNL